MCLTEAEVVSLLTATICYVLEGAGGSFVERIISRFPLSLGFLLLKFGKFTMVVNGDQKLPHQERSQSQQQDRSGDRKSNHQHIRTLRTLWFFNKIEEGFSTGVFIILEVLDAVVLILVATVHRVLLMKDELNHRHNVISAEVIAVLLIQIPSLIVFTLHTLLFDGAGVWAGGTLLTG